MIRTGVPTPVPTQITSNGRMGHLRRGVERRQQRLDRVGEAPRTGRWVAERDADGDGEGKAEDSTHPAPGEVAASDFAVTT